MLRSVIYLMIYLGTALMVYNIYGFASLARQTRFHRAFQQSAVILYVPVALLVLFLLGYLAVAFFGHPDWIVASILLGGSVFVCIIYQLIRSIIQRIIDAEQLETRLRVAQETNQAKNNFMASVSHEMRTPLNVILGLDGLALRSEALLPETRDYLERIGVSARHLLGLISNVLDMNRIDNGELSVKQEEFSLSEVLGEITLMADTLCKNKSLRFEAELPAEDRRYIGDQALLRQALFSILDNAVKYTDAPGTVRLRLRHEKEEGRTRTLCFTVEDTGVGMDPEFLPRVFDSFAQEDVSFTNRFGGSGLGLAVTKNVVELMGGEIRAESRKGVGSTFTVRLPMTLSETGNEAPAPESLESLEGRRVLVAEDLPDNAEIVRDLLELEGVETDHAENGQIALDMFRASEPDHYDAILMDLRMPVMDGLEATRRIRALDRPDARTVPILALTANAFESDVKESLAAGMNVHLAKPADADTLYTTLKLQIAAREERRKSP